MMAAPWYWLESIWLVSKIFLLGACIFYMIHVDWWRWIVGIASFHAVFRVAILIDGDLRHPTERENIIT